MVAGLEQARGRALDWIAANRAEAEVLCESMERTRYALARADINTFVEVVGREEGTGALLVQAPHHERFQELAATQERFVLWAHIESAKSMQLTVLRTLWLLGHNPDLRIAICSATQGQSKKALAAIKAYIEKPGPLHEVFPALRPGDKWSDTAITIASRESAARDYSVQALGVGSGILGARLDLVILDDVLDYENTRTAHSREEVWQWWKTTIAGRIVAGGQAYAVTTAWHPRDMLHRLVKEEGWAEARFPVENARGELLWPERWPRERVELERTRKGPYEFARQCLCIARDDEEARFKREWVDTALRKGNGRKLTPRLKLLPPGFSTYTGVDIGVKDKKRSDPSALVTLAIHPNQDREVLWVESGKWTGPELLRRIESTHQRFLSIVLVENNAAQDFILQFSRERNAVPVLPFHTGSNKAHPEFGIESLAVEMSNGKWIIPNNEGVMAPEVQALVDEMLFYAPASHTGDRLMGAWMAREGAYRNVGKKRRARVGRLELGRR